MSRRERNDDDLDSFDDFTPAPATTAATAQAKQAAKKFVPRGAKALGAASASASTAVTATPSTAAAAEKITSHDGSCSEKKIEPAPGDEMRKPEAGAKNPVSDTDKPQQPQQKEPEDKKRTEKKVRDFISQLKSGGTGSWLGGK